MSSKANKKATEKKAPAKEKKGDAADEKETKGEKKRTPYMDFCAKHRQALKDQGLSFADISKKLGEMWATDPNNPNAGKPKKAKKATSEEAPAEEEAKLKEANAAKITEHEQSVAKEALVED